MIMLFDYILLGTSGHNTLWDAICIRLCHALDVANQCNANCLLQLVISCNRLQRGVRFISLPKTLMGDRAAWTAFALDFIQM